MYCTSSEQLAVQFKHVRPKSLYRSRAGSHFFGIEYEIWADFGLVVNTEKKWADYKQLLRLVTSCFRGQKKNGY